MERDDQENKDGDEDSEVKHNQSEGSGDTLVINDSMETDDREYEPTTKDSEERVISTLNKLLGYKKTNNINKDIQRKK